MVTGRLRFSSCSARVIYGLGSSLLGRIFIFYNICNIFKYNTDYCMWLNMSDNTLGCYWRKDTSMFWKKHKSIILETYLYTCGHYHDCIDNNAIGACVKNAGQNHTVAPLWSVIWDGRWSTRLIRQCTWNI
jgi:hypothetical protein